MNVYSKSQKIIPVENLGRQAEEISLILAHDADNENFLLNTTKYSAKRQINISCSKAIHKNEIKHRVCLTQHNHGDVLKLIDNTKRKYSNEQECVFCKFTSKDLRALSVHVTKIHRYDCLNIILK